MIIKCQKTNVLKAYYVKIWIGYTNQSFNGHRFIELILTGLHEHYKTLENFYNMVALEILKKREVAEGIKSIGSVCLVEICELHNVYRVNEPATTLEIPYKEFHLLPKSCISGMAKWLLENTHNPEKSLENLVDV